MTFGGGVEGASPSMRNPIVDTGTLRCLEEHCYFGDFTFEGTSRLDALENAS